MAPRVKVASLKKMTSNVRDKKAAAPKKNSPSVNSYGHPPPVRFSDMSSGSSSSADSGNESDSDSDVNAAREKLYAKLFSKKKASSDTKKPDRTKQSVKSVKNLANAEPKSKPQSSESESDSESDSDSDSIPTRDAEPTPAPANGAATKPSAHESDSDTSSSDSSDDEDEGKPKDTIVVKGTTEAQTTAKSQAAESDSSSDSESSSDDEPGETVVNGDSNALSRVDGDTSESSANVARPNWLNNSDFTLRKASSDNPGKEVADFFNKTNLEGKQVWYFTAPASLPITVLKEMEIDLAKATAGNAILNHQGDGYGLDLEAHATSTQIQLLIPSKGGEKYTTVNRGIDSTVHLRRMAKFGPAGTVSSTATDQYAPQPKAIREQPEGLRTRFTPLGVPVPPPAQPTSTFSNAQKATKPAAQASADSSSESESESDSDEEMADAAAPTSTPSKAVANSKLKRKQPEEEQTPQAITKDKRQKSSKPASATGMTKGAQAAKSATAKKETPITAPNIAQLASGATSSTGTPSKSTTTSSKKDKKEKKNKTATPSTAPPVKQTPIPLPKFPGMKS